MSPARRPAAAVTALSDPAAQLRVDAACRTLALPTVRAEAGRIAAAAARERLSHGAFLAEVLTAECDDRDARRRVRLVREAKFPRAKRLTNFDLTALPDLPPATWPSSPTAPGSTPVNPSCCSAIPAPGKPTC